MVLILLGRPPALRAQSAPLEAAPNQAPATLSIERAQLIVETCPDLIDNEIEALRAQLFGKIGAYQRLITAAQLSLDFIINNLAQMAFEQAVLEPLPLQLETVAENFNQAHRSYDDSLEHLLDFGADCAGQELAFANALQDMISKRQKLEMAAEELIELISSDFSAAFDQLEKKLIELHQQTSQ